MTVSTIDAPETISKALRSIRDAGMPVSIEHVARSTGMAWHQARALLFKMALDGRVTMVNTTKGYVFSLKEGNMN